MVKSFKSLLNELTSDNVDDITRQFSSRLDSNNCIQIFNDIASEINKEIEHTDNKIHELLLIVDSLTSSSISSTSNDDRNILISITSNKLFLQALLKIILVWKSQSELVLIEELNQYELAKTVAKPPSSRSPIYLNSGEYELVIFILLGFISRSSGLKHIIKFDLLNNKNELSCNIAKLLNTSCYSYNSEEMSFEVVMRILYSYEKSGQEYKSNINKIINSLPLLLKNQVNNHLDNRNKNDKNDRLISSNNIRPILNPYNQSNDKIFIESVSLKKFIIEISDDLNIEKDYTDWLDINKEKVTFTDNDGTLISFPYSDIRQVHFNQPIKKSRKVQQKNGEILISLERFPRNFEVIYNDISNLESVPLLKFIVQSTGNYNDDKDLIDLYEKCFNQRLQQVEYYNLYSREAMENFSIASTNINNDKKSSIIAAMTTSTTTSTIDDDNDDKNNKLKKGDAVTPKSKMNVKVEASKKSIEKIFSDMKSKSPPSKTATKSKKSSSPTITKSSPARMRKSNPKLDTMIETTTKAATPSKTLSKTPSRTSTKSSGRTRSSSRAKATPIPTTDYSVPPSPISVPQSDISTGGVGGGGDTSFAIVESDSEIFDPSTSITGTTSPLLQSSSGDDEEDPNNQGNVMSIVFAQLMSQQQSSETKKRTKRTKEAIIRANTSIDSFVKGWMDFADVSCNRAEKSIETKLSELNEQCNQLCKDINYDTTRISNQINDLENSRNALESRILSHVKSLKKNMNDSKSMVTSTKSDLKRLKKKFQDDYISNTQKVQDNRSKKNMRLIEAFKSI